MSNKPSLYKMVKADPMFDKEVEDIIRKRYGDRVDKKPVPRQLVQRKIVRHPLWNNMKLDLFKVKFLPEDTRGQFAGFSIFNIFTFMIVAFIAVVLFAGYIWVSGLLNDTFTDIGVMNDAASSPSQAGYVNMTYAAQITFGQMNSSIQALRLVAVTLIFSMMLSIVLANFLIKVHPAFFFPYMLIVFLAVVFAVPISNSYETLLNSGIYDNMLYTFNGANYILLHLPATVAIVGILGAIILFVNILRSENEGGIR